MASLTDNKLHQLEQEVDETVAIMRENVEKAMERGSNLEDLEERTENLRVHFEKTSLKEPDENKETLTVLSEETTLNERDENSEKINEESKVFHETTKKIKKQLWWKTKKWQIILISSAVGIILIIVLAIVLSIQPWKDQKGR